MNRFSVAFILAVAASAIGCGHLGTGPAPAADSTPSIIRGRVDDGRGIARSDVVVVAIRADSAGGTRTGISDQLGVFTIEGVPPGRYRLLLLRGEDRYEAGQVTVGASGVYDVALQVAPEPTLAGR